MNLINESEIYGKWSPIIESTTGIEDKSKLEWMSKYCHNHELYENNSMAQVGSVNGMGAVRFPGQPGSQAAFGTQDPGSGDKPYTLLPLAMQVAAQTVGLDLVPVVPMNGPMGILTYLDFVYGGGKIPTIGQTAGFPATKKNYLELCHVLHLTSNTPSTDKLFGAAQGEEKVNPEMIFNDNIFKYIDYNEKKIT